ncbi:MAG TPA: hypothetical protein VGF23_05145 [Gaiellaceae bacterium]|jgi:hypothetical protein
MGVACIALLVALGGTSVAAVTATVPNNSVGTPQLKKDAVTSDKIKSGAVQSAEIKDGTIGGNDIKNAAVSNAKLAGSSVTSDKVKDGSLQAHDFAAGQIPAGPAGPAGPPGIAGLERQSNQSALTSGTKTVSVSCPGGKKVIGGGVSVSGDGANKVSVTESFPEAALGSWTATAVEATPSTATWRITVYALCATVAS